MKRCPIARADGPVPLCDNIKDTPWESATPIPIEEFPWDVAASTQSTTVRPLYDDDALYLQYLVEDSHSYAETTELNGPVWEDSCVEVFVTVDPERRPHYFNFEVNCVGTFHLGFGPDRHERELVTADLAETIQIETSIEGPTKDESPDDEGWWVAVALPFETLSTVTGVPVSPSEGTAWRGNFHRLGGKSDPQFAVWNPVDAPQPDFHRPSEFGHLIFE